MVATVLSWQCGHKMAFFHIHFWPAMPISILFLCNLGEPGATHFQQCEKSSSLQHHRAQIWQHRTFTAIFLSCSLKNMLGLRPHYSCPWLWRPRLIFPVKVLLGHEKSRPLPQISPQQSVTLVIEATRLIAGNSKNESSEHQPKAATLLKLPLNLRQPSDNTNRHLVASGAWEYIKKYFLKMLLSLCFPMSDHIHGQYSLLPSPLWIRVSRDSYRASVWLQKDMSQRKTCHVLLKSRSAGCEML